MPKPIPISRALSITESDLVLSLLNFAKIPHRLEHPLHQTQVIDLADDGGMGSFEFCYNTDNHRQLATPLVEAETYDMDGTKVMLQLSLDEQGYLYQLNSWRADFHPLLSPLGTVNILENIVTYEQ